LRIAVIDSSPLINLSHLNLAFELANFFDRVYVPRAVQRELNRKGRFRYRLNKLFATGLFERCATADATNVAFLRAELDEGESEALIQAQERQAHAFIGDDRQARIIAERMGRKSIGTARLLARLSLEGRAENIETLVAVLRKDLNFRISDEVLKKATEIAVEPI
jgi:predicted nucleic acid-binding protein